MARRNAIADADIRQGHYSEDGRWWWDDERQEWFRTTAPTETLQIELEDHGHNSVARSIVTTLTGQSGVQSYWFVARRRGDATDAYITSPTFPMLPLQIAPGRPIPEAGWPDEVHDAFNALKDALAARGWRAVDTGKQWWSTIYSRPSIDWGTPPAAYEEARGDATER